MTSTATSALSATSTVLFGLLFACYFLSGKRKTLEVTRRMVRAFIPEKHQEEVFRSGTMLNDCFHDFIVCQAAQALIIGAVTWAVCLAGLFLGRKAGVRLAGKATILGGVILILIGLEILLTHIL